MKPSKKVTKLAERLQKIADEAFEIDESLGTRTESLVLFFYGKAQRLEDAGQ